MVLETALPSGLNQGLLWQGLTLRLPQGVLVLRLVESLTLCVFTAESLDTRSDCHAYKNDQFKTVALVAVSQCRTHCGCGVGSAVRMVCFSEKADYSLFITIGSVSLPGQRSVPVHILRDTGAAQSILLEGVVPLSARTATGSHALVRGIEMGFLKVPLHRVMFSSGLVTGIVVVGVCASLPVPGVEFILGGVSVKPLRLW